MKRRLPITIDDIRATKARIGKAVTHTPLIPSDAASERAGLPVFLKLENLQHTGSFKVRGALGKVTTLSRDELRRGIICASTGNHGLGVAYASARFCARCVVVLPKNANPHKMELLKDLGAQVVNFGVSSDARQGEVERLCKRHGYAQIHPFADPSLISGQGSVGLEILEDFPQVNEVYVPIGGGGLISGVAMAIKEQSPQARIYGVEPDHSDAMAKALRHLKPIALNRVKTIADGLAARVTEDLNLSIVRRYVDDIILVSDREILCSMLFLLEQCKLLAEPSGSASLAGLFANRKRRGCAVAIISGGNIALKQIQELQSNQIMRI